MGGSAPRTLTELGCPCLLLLLLLLGRASSVRYSHMLILLCCVDKISQGRPYDHTLWGLTRPPSPPPISPPALDQIGLPCLACSLHATADTGRGRAGRILDKTWTGEAWDARGWDSLWAARESETRAAPCLPPARPPGKGSRGPRYLSPCLPLGPHPSRLWGKLPQMGGRRSTDAIRHVCLARFIAPSPSPARGPSPRRPVLAWLLMAQDRPH